MQVRTYSVRAPKDPTVVSDTQRQLAATTNYILPAKPAEVARAHFSALKASPSRYFASIKLAAHTHRPGLKGALLQVAYFTEAGVLAQTMQIQHVTHLHNHFEDSSCTVAMLTSALSGIPFSFSMHGSAIFFAPESWHLRAKLERATFVSCVSWFTRSQGCLFVGEEHWSKLHVVHCGIDPEMYKPVQHRQGPTRIVFVARLAEGKGLEVALDAFQSISDRFPQASFDIVGDGPTAASIRQRVASMGLQGRVTLHGATSPDEVAAILNSASIFVIASFAEGVPTVIMEAMGAGLPVVATQVGGIAEIVSDGVNGYLVRPGDPEAVAARLSQLIDDPQLRQTLGAAGRRLVEQEFCSRAEAGRLATLFAAASPTALPIRPEAP